MRSDQHHGHITDREATPAHVEPGGLRADPGCRCRSPEETSGTQGLTSVSDTSSVSRVSTSRKPALLRLPREAFAEKERLVIQTDPQATEREGAAMQTSSKQR